MSRWVRQQLFETLDTLQEASQLIVKLIKDDQKDELIVLLTECQNCAIAIGTKIDNVYGENLECVRFLEKCCESIYELSESQNSLENSLEIYKRLEEQIYETKIHMKRELPDKQEVVFLPYKAAMWDSLESLYLQAKEDENCEVYMVPIPYYDRKADRSLGTMHYEGDLYSNDIEITDWKKYNFEERRPDVVLIHNPYDDCNSVTCVHSRFFCSNLKKYTNKLVYVPYFVLGEIEPDNQVGINRMKHFCFLPGTIYADKVILQSEKMAEIYINEYQKESKNHSLSGEHIDKDKLKEKFLGLGSPKFDKVMNTKKDELDVPTEWTKIIEKQDGSWKKVVFYNTTVAALLSNTKQWIEKIKLVLELFKNQQTEVTLLWRPHPLVSATIEAMRPEFIDEYEMIVEKYKSEGWGIFDDTVDLNRAMMMSDMYYGDHSSLVYLFRKVGKSAKIQQIQTLSDDNCLYEIMNGIDR